jgi:hypothetical protein
MKKRKITPAEVIRALLKGVITEGPVHDIKGCWRSTMERRMAGESLAVSVSICGDDLVIVTAY